MVLVGAAGAERHKGEAGELTRLERQHARSDLVEAPRGTRQHPARDADRERDQQSDQPQAGHEKTTVLLP